MDEMKYCRRCGGRIEKGFILDASFGEDYATQSMWAKGEPHKSIWTGVKNKVRYAIDTYRCSQCGYLESFAADTDV